MNQSFVIFVVEWKLNNIFWKCLKIFGSATHLRKRWRGWKENTGMHQNLPPPAPEATAFNRETYPASFCNLFKEILSFRGWLPENTHGQT